MVRSSAIAGAAIKQAISCTERLACCCGRAGPFQANASLLHSLLVLALKQAAISTVRHSLRQCRACTTPSAPAACPRRQTGCWPACSAPKRSWRYLGAQEGGSKLLPSPAVHRLPPCHLLTPPPPPCPQQIANKLEQEFAQKYRGGDVNPLSIVMRLHKLRRWVRRGAAGSPHLLAGLAPALRFSISLASA